MFKQIVLIVFLGFVLIGCGNVNGIIFEMQEDGSECLTNKDSLVEILNRTDNTTENENLIKNFYPENILLKYNRQDVSLASINLECPVECIRQINNQYYTVHKSKEGGILYLVYEYSENDELKSVDHWYIKNDLIAKKFERLVINTSSYLEVKKIDPYANYLMGYTGSTTFDSHSTKHLTKDGYEIWIKYNAVFEEQEIEVRNQKTRVKYATDYIVSNIKIDKASSESVYGKILSIDKPGKTPKTET